MENNITATMNTNQSNSTETVKKVYQSPKLKHYGSLSEIVQSQPGGGNDAGGSNDCNLS